MKKPDTLHRIYRLLRTVAKRRIGNLWQLYIWFLLH